MLLNDGRQQLALFGAEPAFRDVLHVGRPNIGNRDQFLARVHDILDRRWLSNDGPFVQELERRIAEYTGVRNCVVMCNGTVALEIAIRALDLSGEVIIPSYTFIATAHALQWQQITPIFADIGRNTHTLDPDSVERMITPRTTGIIGVHLWGRPCDVDALAEIATRRHLHLMFDAAHAFGASHRGRFIGNNGECEVFSFHATKFMNSLEGGAVVTNDDTLAKKMQLMRNFGFGGLDKVVSIGTNGKMDEIAAAMGLTSLDSLVEFIQVNARNYNLYRDQLAGISGITPLLYNEGEKVNYQYIVLEVDSERAGLSRDELIKVLLAENVFARRYFWPGCHRMEPYVSLQPHAGMLLPVTESVAARVLLLPTGTAITPEMIKVICSIIRAAVQQADSVASLLRHSSNGNQVDSLPRGQRRPPNHKPKVMNTAAHPPTEQEGVR